MNFICVIIMGKEGVFKMRITKNIITAVIIISIFFALGGCGKKSKIDYQTMIDSFVSGPLNTFELVVGDEAAPQASIWLKDGEGTVYTDNENVVTVTELGKVTAMGEGSAHVVITGPDDSMFEVYRYDVYPPVPEADLSKLPQISGVDFLYEIENFASSGVNTFDIKIGETHRANGAVWAEKGTCYTSDETVVTIAKNGNVTAVGRGTAYVLIKSPIGSMFQVTKYTVKG